MATEKAEEVTPKRTLLVYQGKKAFTITVPENAKTTFGPWVPPGMRGRDVYGTGSSVGTLRVYGKTEKHVLGVFSGVTGFRDLSLEYCELESELMDALVTADSETEDELPF